MRAIFALRVDESTRPFSRDLVHCGPGKPGPGQSPDG